jgi:hypothetical protein
MKILSVTGLTKLLPGIACAAGKAGEQASNESPANRSAVELSSARRLFLLALVSSMCATAALAVAILLFSDFDETAGRILGTTAAISFVSVLALPAGVLVDRGKAVALAWVSLATSATAFVLALVLLWIDWDDIPDRLWKSLLAATAFAIAGAQACATTIRRRREDARGVRALYVLGLALSVAAATMAAVAAWAEIERTGYYRALGAVVVLGVLATLLQPALRRFGGAGEARSQARDRLRLTLADGATLELEEDGRDFAESVARAIRKAESSGGAVTRVERLGPV